MLMLLYFAVGDALWNGSLPSSSSAHSKVTDFLFFLASVESLYWLEFSTLSLLLPACVLGLFAGLTTSKSIWKWVNKGLIQYDNFCCVHRVCSNELSFPNIVLMQLSHAFWSFWYATSQPLSPTLLLYEYS